MKVSIFHITLNNIITNTPQFIDENDIELINQSLSFNTSDCHVTGGCDLFTTKPVGSDRKLYKTIDKHFDALIENNNESQNIISPNDIFLEQRRRFSSSDVYPPHQQQQQNGDYPHVEHSSPRSLETTPFGPLNQTASRRTFAYLIGILNATYPDNDFSSLEPTDFQKINLTKLKSKFDNTLISLGKSSDQNWIYDIINSHMDLNDCAFYELNLDESSSSFLDDEPGHLWTLKWFIFNKKRKRVAFLYLNGYRLSSPKLNPNLSLSRRRLTIDNDDDDFEEYDLTYSDDEVMYDDDDDDEDGYEYRNSNNQVVGNIELEMR